MNYTFYQDKNKIIAISSYAGKTVKGYAKCAPEDTFNTSIGKELAAARCGAKIALKRRKAAEKKYHDAVQELYAAQAKLEKMSNYLIDANARALVARDEVKKIEDAIK